MALLVLERLHKEFSEAVIEMSSPCGNDTAFITRDRLHEVAKCLRDDPDLAFDMPIDCTAVDWLHQREPRFEVIWRLYSTVHHHRLCLKVHVSAEDPTAPSLTDIWRGMNWHERECYDMYGIRFIGHPKLKRILMYEEFAGYPLRKDYPIDKRQPLLVLREVKEVATERNLPRNALNQP